MGSPISPVLANIFMEWFEDTMPKSAHATELSGGDMSVEHLFSSTKLPFHNSMPVSISKKRALSIRKREEAKEYLLPFLDCLIRTIPEGVLYEKAVLNPLLPIVSYGSTHTTH